MAHDNKSIVEIPGTVITQVTDLLNQAAAAIQPYVTPLTNEERRTMAKMSDKTQAFVQKVVGYTSTNPEFVPPFMNAENLSIDYGNVFSLAPLYQLAEQIAMNLSDTEMVAGSEAFISSLMYYNSVKQADKNGIANSKSIYEDLQKRFPGRKGTPKV